MDRDQILHQLARAERHVIDGNTLINEQRALLQKMIGEGQDVTTARGFLEECEQMQRAQIADRDRLRKMLAHARTSSPPSRSSNTE